MKEEIESKVKGMVGLYNFYKYEMNTVQRIGLLTFWIDLCIQKEEYEVAAGLQKEMDKIINGEEDFYLLPPMVINEEEKKEVVLVKKKLKFVNYWGTGTYEFFRLSFRDFKFIIFNFGVEIK